MGFRINGVRDQQQKQNHRKRTDRLSKMMMNNRAASGGRWYHPFTARQWQELEDQSLFYKYMISGIPIPPHLIYTIRASLDSSTHPPPNVGRRKADGEEAGGGRCRRTDGKKWRCSKEACPDSKYCQKHMHRGRNRSRKSVELSTPIPYRKSNGMKDDECFKTSLGGASWQLAINNNTSSSNPSENAYSLQQQDDEIEMKEEKVMHHFLI
ncbi:putative transcription factor interactor and regulator C3H-WRC/GRF family [Helianthus anomalus]